MKVLIACEESQRVCTEFRKLGHEAFSCDILPTSGEHPEWHIQDNVLNHLHDNWDLIIAHPPCTYISNAGARWLYPNHQINTERLMKGVLARDFFMSFFDAAPMVCIENPVPSRVFRLPEPTQIIQPYMFGEPFSKKTCLWLKNLPLLTPTHVLSDYVPYCSSGSYSKYHDERSKGVSRKGGAARVRSKTFLGIARAMALQWGHCELCAPWECIGCNLGV